MPPASYPSSFALRSWNSVARTGSVIETAFVKDFCRCCDVHASQGVPASDYVGLFDSASNIVDASGNRCQSGDGCHAA